MERTRVTTAAWWVVIGGLVVGGGALGLRFAPEGAATAPAVAPAPEPAPAQPPEYVGAHALEEDGRVVSCSDWGTTDPAAHRRMLAMPKEPDLIALPSTCEDAFPGRRPLATCTVTFVGVVSMSERHYDFERVFSTDQLHLDCVKHSGAWTQISEDSLDYQQSEAKYESKRRRGHAEDLLRRVDDMQRRYGR